MKAKENNARSNRPQANSIILRMTARTVVTPQSPALILKAALAVLVGRALPEEVLDPLAPEDAGRLDGVGVGLRGVLLKLMVEAPGIGTVTLALAP
jgi:hypothetical protein